MRRLISDFKKLVSMGEEEVLSLVAGRLREKGGRAVTQTKDYVYAVAEGEKSVLLVAHADTVHEYGEKKLQWWLTKGKTKAEAFVTCKEQGLGADDRAGVTAILSMLSLPVSVLVTTGEEIGGIGANAFLGENPNFHHSHHFMAEWDRRGAEQAVFYDCDGEDDFVQFVTSFGFNRQMGSFSDISILMQTGLCGVNLSTGYYNEHTKQEEWHPVQLHRAIGMATKMIEAARTFNFTPFSLERVELGSIWGFPYETTDKLSLLCELAEEVRDMAGTAEGKLSPPTQWELRFYLEEILADAEFYGFETSECADISEEEKVTIIKQAEEEIFDIQSYKG